MFGEAHSIVWWCRANNPVFSRSRCVRRRRTCFPQTRLDGRDSDWNTPRSIYTPKARTAQRPCDLLNLNLQANNNTANTRIENAWDQRPSWFTQNLHFAIEPQPLSSSLPPPSLLCVCVYFIPFGVFCPRFTYQNTRTQYARAAGPLGSAERHRKQSRTFEGPHLQPRTHTEKKHTIPRCKIHKLRWHLGAY